MPNDYLVRYGLAGYVGRFAAVDAFDRAARVVVRTPRGLEVGELLCLADSSLSVEGDLLRSATADDDQRVAELAALAGRVLAAAHAFPDAAFLDAEPLLDGSAVILHALPAADADLSSLLDELSAAFGMPVRLLDVRQSLGSPDPVDKGCGKPGCGSGGGCSTGGCSTGGGCGTGSCSSGKVKSADELTTYFADLRTKMEADGRRTPLHG